MTNGHCKTNRFFDDLTMTTTMAKTRSGGVLDPCSGSEEEEYLEVEVHSPTDSSEDSVEVKVSPICLRNKRKCAEPRKVPDATTAASTTAALYASAPPKKRMCFKRSSSDVKSEPFRPWNAADQTKATASSPDVVSSIISPKPDFLVPAPPPHHHQHHLLHHQLSSAQRIFVKPIPTYLHQLHHHQQLQHHHHPSLIRPSSPNPLPLSLVKKEEENTQSLPAHHDVTTTITAQHHREHRSKSPPVTIKREPPECCEHSRVPPLHQEDITVPPPAPSSTSSTPSATASGLGGRKEQRNYKNMTRERRIEANARERTRVHTISAAFETLRRCVPAYSHNQKLSKLSVLRIACSYIMTLSTLAGQDDDDDDEVIHSGGEEDDVPTLAQCVESVSKTIQKEGKLKKKKEDSD